MAELPASWELTTQPRDDGRLDIVGKADDGTDYVARTTESHEVTEKDLAALRRGDREAYDGDRDKAVRTLVKGFSDEAAQNKAAWENRMLDEYTEAALPVAEAGCGHRAYGMNTSYGRARRYERMMKKAGLW